MLVDFSPVEITTECSSMDKDLRADIAKKFQSAREINLSSAYAGDTIQDRLKHKQRAEMNVSMFVVASYDKVFGYWPSLSAICCPEKVVLRMIVKQAAATAKQLISFFSSENIVELASRKGMSSKEIDIRREEEIKSILGIASDKSDNRSPLSICNSWLTFHKGIRSSHPGEGPKFASLKVFANMSSKDYSVNSLVVR